MYQFFVEECQISEKSAYIDGDDFNHIKNVLRMKKGEEINIVVNGRDDEIRCEISDFSDDRVNLNILFVKQNNVELPVKIYLFQGLPKSDKMETIIQKAVELGVYEVIPVSLKRSVVKLDDKKATSKRTRWQGVSEAAAKQSKRRIIPDVKMPMTLSGALKYIEEECIDVRVVPYEMCDNDTMALTRKILEGVNKGDKVAIFIGPEGGFEEGEIEELRSAAFKDITLGRRILRTETAGMTVLSWFVYLFE